MLQVKAGCLSRAISVDEFSHVAMRLEHFHFSHAMYPEFRKQFAQSSAVTESMALAMAL